MSSRINIARPQSNNSYNVDPHGFGNPNVGYRAAPPPSYAASENEYIQKLRAIGSQVEDSIEIVSQPLKPYLPSIGRFLIVVTFLEDALRIMTQWNDQLWYLQK